MLPIMIVLAQCTRSCESSLMCKYLVMIASWWERKSHEAREACLSFSPLYFHHLVHWLAYSQDSNIVCWMNKWMNKWKALDNRFTMSFEGHLVSTMCSLLCLCLYTNKDTFNNSFLRTYCPICALSYFFLRPLLWGKISQYLSSWQTFTAICNYEKNNDFNLPSWSLSTL